MSRVFLLITLSDGKRLLFHDDGSYLRNDLDQRQIIEATLDRSHALPSLPCGYRPRAARCSA